MATLVREGDISHDVWVQLSKPQKRLATEELEDNPIQRMRLRNTPFTKVIEETQVTPAQCESAANVSWVASTTQPDSEDADLRSEVISGAYVSIAPSPVHTRQLRDRPTPEDDMREHTSDASQTRPATTGTSNNIRTSEAAQAGSKLKKTLDAIRNIADPLLEYRDEQEALPRTSALPTKKKSLLQNLTAAATEVRGMRCCLTLLGCIFDYHARLILCCV